MLKDTKLKISITKIIAFIVFTLSINITYFNQLLRIDQIWVFVLRLTGIGILILLYILRRKRITKTMKYVILLYCVIVFSTILNRGNLSNAVQILSRPIFICLYYNYFSEDEKRRYQILETWNYILGILSILDVVIAIFMPNGLYSGELYSGIGFLGYKTERLVYSLTWVIINAYLYIKKKNKIGVGIYFSVIISALGAYLSDATGASLCMIVVAILFLFTDVCKSSGNTKFFYKVFNYKTICIVYGVVFVALVVLQDSSIVLNFVQNVLGKSATLTGRTVIWQLCLTQSLKKPFLGLGFLDASEYIEICLGAQAATNAHNFLLSIFVTSGIVGISLYVMLIVHVTKIDIKRIRLSEIILIIGILGSLFMGLTSSTLTFCPFTFIFCLMLENEKRISYIRL